MARLFVVARLLEAQGEMPIQLDIIPIALARERSHDYAALSLDTINGESLSDLVSPLVMA